MFSANSQPTEKRKRKKKSTYGRRQTTKHSEQTKHSRCIANAGRRALNTIDINEPDAIEDAECIDNEDGYCFEEQECKMTMEERTAMGLLVVTQEETRVAIKVCYVMEYGEPDEDDWPSIIAELSTRFRVTPKVVRRVFADCRGGKKNAEKQKEGAGRKHKLSHNNAGLIAGAAALNGSASPYMATEICNAVNKTNFPDEYEAQYKICRNTLMSTLQAYTDFETKAILWRKTGKKDNESDWAVARKTIAEQILDQIETGKKIDNGEITLQEAFQNVETSDAPPPLFQDSIMYLDENHTVATLGGAGHDGSFSRKQHMVSVDKDTGQLKRKSEGGVMPQRRYRVVAKYTSEARGCYGVCSPILANDEEKPQFMATWNYTGRTLVSLKEWNKRANAEMAYRRGSKYAGWARYNGANPYLERYGDEWEKELANSPSMRTIRYVHPRAHQNTSSRTLLTLFYFICYLLPQKR